MKLVLLIAAVAVSSALLGPTVAQAAVQEYEQVGTTLYTRPGESEVQFERRLHRAMEKMCSAGRERLLALRRDTDRCIAGAKASVEPKLAGFGPTARS